MENISTQFNPIFFKDLNKLKELTKSSSEAELLAYIHHYWRISRFILNDGQKYFTHRLDVIAKFLGKSTRSVERYLKSLSEQGLIKKVCRLKGVKRLYIRVTQKFLAFISHKNVGNDPDILSETYIEQYSNIYLTNTSNTNNPRIATKNNFFSVSDSDFESYEQYQPDISELESWEKKKIEALENSNMQHAAGKQKKKSGVEQSICRELTNTQKQYIETTVKNLQEKVDITNPHKLHEEIIEAVLNPKRFSHSKNFKHRINTIAKSIRDGYWYKNFEVNYVPDSKESNVFNDSKCRVFEQERELDLSDNDFTEEENVFWAGLFTYQQQINIDRTRL